MKLIKWNCCNNSRKWNENNQGSGINTSKLLLGTFTDVFLSLNIHKKLLCNCSSAVTIATATAFTFAVMITMTTTITAAAVVAVAITLSFYISVNKFALKMWWFDMAASSEFSINLSFLLSSLFYLNNLFAALIIHVLPWK